MLNGKEYFLEIVKNSKSISDICRALDIRPVGGNYKTVRTKIKKYDADISHFTGQGWLKGRTHSFSKKYTLTSILVANSSYQNSSLLKKRLLKEGLKESICEGCGISEWMDKPLSLELHHKNGVNTDHRIENLQILCPNCHCQTPTHKGKNKLSALSEKRDVEYRKFGESLLANATADPEPSLIKKEGVETRHGKPRTPVLNRNCLFCSLEFKPRDIVHKYCSVVCYKSYERKINDVPKVPAILEAFQIYKSFVQVGKHFGVSDNAVRKWCTTYGILEMVKV